MLGEKLVQRGITLSGGTLALALAPNAALASLPTSLLSTTINIACLSAARHAVVPGLISIEVAALTKGVLNMMCVTKLKTMLAAMLVGGIILGSGAGFSVIQTAEAQVKVKPGVGPGSGNGTGDSATPLPAPKPTTPVKVKPGVGPGSGNGK
jgi:hypothetical protein